MESIRTNGPLYAHVESAVQTLPGITVQAGDHGGSTVAPGPLMGRRYGVLIPKLDLDKSGGQGGSLKARGHAYIGRNPIPFEDTHEEDTKVKLLEENIIGR